MMRHYDLSQRDRPWHSDMYRRDAQHDAEGWLPDDSDFDPCPVCGAADWSDDDGGCNRCGWHPILDGAR